MTTENNETMDIETLRQQLADTRAQLAEAQRLLVPPDVFFGEQATAQPDNARLWVFVRHVFNYAALGGRSGHFKSATRGERYLFELGLEAGKILASLPPDGAGDNNGSE